MITGEIKNKIDSLWDIFAAGGLTNPLEVIEQITYLMFIKELDTSDNKREKESSMLGLTFKSIFSEKIYIGERSIEGKQLKWSIFRDYPANKQYEIMQEWVFPFIKDLHDDKDSAYSKYMSDAIFKLPTPLVLSKVIDSLDEIYELMDKEEKNMTVNELKYVYIEETMSALGNEELMEAILDAVRKVKVKFQERQEVSDSLFGDVPALPHSIAQLKERWLI